jgi:hypothetical protein
MSSGNHSGNSGKQTKRTAYSPVWVLDTPYLKSGNDTPRLIRYPDVLEIVD